MKQTKGVPVAKLDLTHINRGRQVGITPDDSIFQRPIKTDSSTLGQSSSDRSVLDYKSLSIPETPMLKEIFSREGRFDFDTYIYPLGIDVNMLNFYRPG